MKLFISLILQILEIILLVIFGFGDISTFDLLMCKIIFGIFLVNTVATIAFGIEQDFKGLL